MWLGQRQFLFRLWKYLIKLNETIELEKKKNEWNKNYSTNTIDFIVDSIGKSVVGCRLGPRHKTPQQMAKNVCLNKAVFICAISNCDLRFCDFLAKGWNSKYSFVICLRIGFPRKNASIRWRLLVGAKYKTEIESSVFLLEDFLPMETIFRQHFAINESRLSF